MLRAKLYFFFKKSVWMYLLGMLLLGYALPFDTFGVIPSTLIYFLLFTIIILVPVYHFSAKALANSNAMDADVEFSDQSIVIRHRNKDLVETKDWSWIKQIDLTGKAVLLVVNQSRRFLITIDRGSLTDSEWQFFNKIKAEKFR